MLIKQDNLCITVKLHVNTSQQYDEHRTGSKFSLEDHAEGLGVELYRWILCRGACEGIFNNLKMQIIFKDRFQEVPVTPIGGNEISVENDSTVT